MKMLKALCGVSTICLLFAGCQKPEDATPVVPPVQTIVLEQSGEAPFRRFPGQVAALDSSEMSFDVSGRLIEFPATQGLAVKRGDLLGRLDPANFQARVDSARADFTNAEAEFSRQRQLHERGVISRSELDRFQRLFEVTGAALREAQRALDDTRMLAPLDGRVARTLVNNFQSVQAKQPVLVFQNVSGLEIDIQVPEADMTGLARGITAENARHLLDARAEFAAAAGQSFDLELKSFSTEATPAARTFRVTFYFAPPEGLNILPGMTCTVLLRLRDRAEGPGDGSFLVPVRAVSTGDGKGSLWKLDPASMQVSRVGVEMLGVTGEAMQVRSPDLSIGDEVVTSGVRFLSEGMTVRRMESQ